MFVCSLSVTLDVEVWCALMCQTDLFAMGECNMQLLSPLTCSIETVLHKPQAEGAKSPHRPADLSRQGNAGPPDHQVKDPPDTQEATALPGWIPPWKPYPHLPACGGSGRAPRPLNRAYRGTGEDEPPSPLQVTSCPSPKPKQGAEVTVNNTIFILIPGWLTTLTSILHDNEQKYNVR